MKYDANKIYGSLRQAIIADPDFTPPTRDRLLIALDGAHVTKRYDGSLEVEIDGLDEDKEIAVMVDGIGVVHGIAKSQWPRDLSSGPVVWTDPAPLAP